MSRSGRLSDADKHHLDVYLRGRLLGLITLVAAITAILGGVIGWAVTKSDEATVASNRIELWKSEEALKGKVEAAISEVQQEAEERIQKLQDSADDAWRLVGALSGRADSLGQELDGVLGKKEALDRQLVKMASQLSTAAGELADKLKKDETFRSEFLKLIEGDLVQGLIPLGTIVAWDPFERDARGEAIGNGSERKRPDGWEICNGENGTPDLTGLFLRGVKFSHLVGKDAHAKATHRHTLDEQTSALHADQNDGQSVSIGKTSRHFAWTDHAHKIKGSTQPVSHIPPNYKVIYIMKVR
ncbi:MAG: hypothetical protein DWQ01_00565 [Planctomycetota bacterium]|nr:MAG: hypothetical protein DWQ01_00565 [Planctomycetota bacterium]